jgi:hypothetical protein
MDSTESEYTISDLPEIVAVDDEGISIIAGEVKKQANWDEVTEIKGYFQSYYASWFLFLFGSKHVISIKTKNWNHEIRSPHYSSKDLKQVYIQIAGKALQYKIPILDEIDWLPNNLKISPNVVPSAIIHLKEYQILSKVAGSLILIGLILTVFVFLNSPQLSNNLGVIGIVLLFMGIMCGLTGLFGIGEEKQKMNNY